LSWNISEQVLHFDYLSVTSAVGNKMKI